MKKILITGAGSYIGTAFAAFAKDRYQIDTLDTLGDAWRTADLSGYDVVFHVAGLAHQKETKENAPLYYTVNRDLAVDMANKAKNEGVEQFIFLSTMSVYGRETGVITPETPPAPASHYGRSKWEAEQAITPLQDEHFRVCILRPPMVYGFGCKGNFQTVVKLVKKLPVFPRIKNERSMIYIENLCAFVAMAIDQRLDGLYFPQNREYLSTCRMASVLADTMGKSLYMSYLCGFGVWVLRPFVGMLKKAFGSLIYEGTEQHNFSYCIAETDDSLRNSLEKPTENS